MSESPRRFDMIERVVRDLRAQLDDLKSTVMTRLASHTHPTPAPPTSTSTDLAFTLSTKGVVLTDRVTGAHYRLYVSSGTLAVEVVP